jgi:hypothetical protein
MDGFQVIQDWLARHHDDPDGGLAVRDALFAIQDGSWFVRYPHVDDLTNDLAVIMAVRQPDIFIRWRQLTEYPDYFKVTYIGPLD